MTAIISYDNFIMMINDRKFNFTVSEDVKNFRTYINTNIQIAYCICLQSSLVDQVITDINNNIDPAIITNLLTSSFKHTIKDSNTTHKILEIAENIVAQLEPSGNRLKAVEFIQRQIENKKHDLISSETLTTHQVTQQLRISSAIEVVDNSEKIFYNNLLQNYSSENVILYINPNQLKSYIKDIGENYNKKYDIHRLDKDQIDQTYHKMTFAWEICKCVIRDIMGYNILEEKKKSKNLHLNSLFSLLMFQKFPCETGECDLPTFLHSLFSNIDEDLNLFIRTFKSANVLNLKKENIIANTLASICEYKSSNFVTLEILLMPLLIWYQKFHTTVSPIPITNEGFIGERLSTKNGENANITDLRVEDVINGNALYADQNPSNILIKGKIDYGKKIYSLLFEILSSPDEPITFYEKYFNTSKKKKLFKKFIKGGMTLEDLNNTTLKSSKFNKPYYWQQEIINKGSNNISFILTGPTSGGKTAMSMMISKNIMTKRITSILYVAPTSQLAFQVYTNMVSTFTGYEKIIVAICTDNLFIVPANYNFLIGTPKDLLNFLNIYSVKEYTSEDPLSLKKVLEKQKLQKFDHLIIDEIHVMSPEIDNSFEGKMRAKCIYELLQCCHSTSQCIGLSATLTNESRQALTTLIRDATGIPIEDANNYTYRLSDLGKYRATDPDPIIPVIQESVKIAISFFKNQIISSEDFNPTEIDGRFLFLFFEDLLKSKKIPNACFPGNEHETLHLFLMLINYLENKNSQCTLWQNLHSLYHNARENLSFSEDNPNVEKNFLEKWFHKVYEAFLVSLNRSDENFRRYEDCPIIQELNVIFIKRGYPLLTSENHPIIYPEMYGCIVEMVNIYHGRIAFASKHPFYRFSSLESRQDLFNIKHSDGKLTRFGALLEDQGITTSHNRGKLTSSIMTGFLYGFGFITSLVPFAIQCELISYLSEHNTSLIDGSLPFIFCDYGMAQGINLGFRSTSIIKMVPEEILPSIYFQIKGRAGRIGYGSNYTPAIYLVNVLNTSRLSVVENISFSYRGIESNFLKNSDLATIAINMIRLLDNSNDSVILRQNYNSYFQLFDPKYAAESLISELHSFNKIRLLRLQFKEIYDRLRSLNSFVTNNYVAKFYDYIFNVEYIRIQE
jgi:hypothetical protein